MYIKYESKTDALIALWFAAFVNLTGNREYWGIRNLMGFIKIYIREIIYMIYDSSGAVWLDILNILKKLVKLEKIIYKNGLKNKNKL